MSLLKRIKSFRDVEKELEFVEITQTFIMPDTIYTISHGLKREPRGWYIIDKDTYGDIYKVSQTTTDIVFACNMSNTTAIIRIL